MPKRYKFLFNYLLQFTLVTNTLHAETGAFKLMVILQFIKKYKEGVLFFKLVWLKGQHTRDSLEQGNMSFYRDY